MYITTPKPIFRGRSKIKYTESNYKPSDEVKEVTQMVMNHWQICDTAKNKPYREFDGLTLLERQSLDQSRFNASQFDSSTSDVDSWKSNAVRPIVRNRCIMIAAHITSKLIYPQVYAQNELDAEDKDSANVMRDLMEWSNEQSNYDKLFVNTAIAALVNPAVIIETGFTRATREIKVPTGKYGEYIKKTIPDEEYSGFYNRVVPLDQFWHPDFYEADIQKQPYIIRRKVISWDAAEAVYGDRENFKYVTPGHHVMFVESHGFFEVPDSSLQEIGVEEVIYWNRRLDLHLVFLNGVLVTPVDNPNPRADKKYPFAKSGYELIDEGQFFYYKSLVAKLGPDEEVVQTFYRMVIDGTYLQLFPPGVIYGDEMVSSSIVVPGSVTSLSKESKFESINIGQNLQAGMLMLSKIEQSINESSLDPMQQGIATTKEQTALEIQSLEDNARKMLGLFGRMLSFLVKDFGHLRIGDIVQYLTLGEVGDISNSAATLKFRKFVLPEKAKHGKGQSRKIEFTTDMPEYSTPESDMEYSFKLLKEAGGLDKQEIIHVNPELFRKLKYSLKVTPELISPRSDGITKALRLEEFDRLIGLPFIDQEAVTKDLLLATYDMTKSDPDKYFKGKKGGDLASLLGIGNIEEDDQGTQTGSQKLFNNMRTQQTMSQTMRT